MKSGLRLAVLIAGLIFQSVGAAATPRYSIVEIPTLGGLSAFPAYPYALNEKGEVAGTADVTFASYGVNPVYHPFVYSRGVMRDLGVGAGPNAMAKAINAKGQVVFESRGLDGRMRSYLYTNGSVVEVGDLGGGMSGPNAINDKGDVVGQAYLPGATSSWRAYFYTNGSSSSIPSNVINDAVAIGVSNLQLVAGNAYVVDFANNDVGTRAFVAPSGRSMTFIGCINENPCANGHASVARVMNASGQFAGIASTPNGELHAFLWTRNKMTDLGALPSSISKYSTAYGISSNGYVTGTSSVGSANHAFLAGNGKIIDVGVLPGCYQSNGFAVNARGEVVGECALAGSSSPWPYAAFLYSAGVIYDLNKILLAPKSFTDRVSLLAGYAITDSGYILAVGHNAATDGVQLYLLKRLQ